MFRRFLIVFAVLAVSACAAKVPAPLTAEQRASYRITKVAVTYPDSSELWWGNGDRAIAGAAGVDQSDAQSLDSYMEKPEAQRALRDLAVKRLEPAIFGQVAGALPGKQPAQLSVRIESAWFASAAQQILVGGNHTLWGAVQLFDLETGEALTQPQRMFGLGGGGSGIVGAIIDAARSDPMVRAGQSFGQFTNTWISADGEAQLPITPEQNIRPAPLDGPEPKQVEAATGS